jgi:hypothetical protein
MDFTDYLRHIPEREPTDIARQRAQDLLMRFRQPTDVERAKDLAYDSTIKALGSEIVEATTLKPSLRIKAYKLHRELGLTTFEALRHSSPAEGIAAAALVPRGERLS